MSSDTSSRHPLVNVLHVINGDFYSGAERVQDLLALRLGQFGYRVGFACLKDGLFAEKRQAKDAPLYRVYMRSRFDLACAWRIASIVRRDRYQVVHTHTPRSALVGRLAALMSGVPMVHHVHSPTARDTEHPLRNRINALMERASMWGVRSLVPVSASLAAHLRAQGYARDRIWAVPNGVPAPSAMSRRDAPCSPWVIGTVALFRPRKGLEILLRALAILQVEGQPVRMLAVGPFESEAYRSSIMALVASLGLGEAIEWTGFTDDVASQFGRMDVFVLPSLYGEGMPMVVLEAMANGVPVVASSVEGVPEVVTHERSGLVVPPADAASLARAVAAIVAGKYDWESMRTHGAAVQREKFSDLSMAAGVADVYAHVLAAAGVRHA